MRNLEDLRREKTAYVLNTFECAMFQNYFGGDTFIIKNVTNNKDNEAFGIVGNGSQWFTADELEYIDRENILDKIREAGWDIEVQRNADNDFVKVEWLFRAIKE